MFFKWVVVGRVKRFLSLGLPQIKSLLFESSLMMVVDRNMEEQVKSAFNVNFKTLSSLIKSAFVGV